MKRLAIVFQETGTNAKGEIEFDIFLDGDKEGMANKKMAELRGAQFWALTSFSVIVDLIKKGNIIKSVTDMTPKGNS